MLMPHWLTEVDLVRSAFILNSMEWTINNYASCTPRIIAKTNELLPEIISILIYHPLPHCESLQSLLVNLHASVNLMVGVYLVLFYSICG